MTKVKKIERKQLGGLEMRQDDSRRQQSGASKIFL